MGDDASKKKDLRAKIQALKKSVPKGDKKKKKEVQAEIAMLEAELELLTVKEDESAPVPEVGFGYKETAEKKPNRQQIRKLKKEAEMQQMIEEAKAESANMVDHRKIEQERLEQILGKEGLKIKEIPADGHCFYSAISHQISFKDEIAPGYKDLRAKTAEFLQSHSNDFIPFMINDAGDMLSEEEFIAYCDKVRNTGEWAGHLEVGLLVTNARYALCLKL